jgi:Protein of unknown function (DUF3292)
MATINPANDTIMNPALMSIQDAPDHVVLATEKETTVLPRDTAIVASEGSVIVNEETDESAPQEYPTDSHELAQNHEGPGAAESEQQNGLKATDLGWDKEPEEIPSLFSDYTNDELWTLIRRFNQVFLRDTEAERLANLSCEEHADGCTQCAGLEYCL